MDNKEITQKNLEESAELYAEVYEEDTETRELTEAAITDWPAQSVAMRLRHQGRAHPYYSQQNV